MDCPGLAPPWGPAELVVGLANFELWLGIHKMLNEIEIIVFFQRVTVSGRVGKLAAGIRDAFQNSSQVEISSGSHVS